MLFADVEGDDLYPAVARLWVIVIGDENSRIAYADQPGYPSISEGLDRLRAASKIVFHNGLGYDFWAINKLYPNTLRRDQVVDSLILCRMKDPESKHSLELLGERIGINKGDHRDFSRFSEQMVTYCLRDVEILQAYWSKLAGYYKAYPQAVECEHAVGYALACQEHHGFRLHVGKAQALERTLRSELLAIERKLQSVFPPITHVRVSEKTGKLLKPKVEHFNPGSRQQIAQRLWDKYKWKPTLFTETGQPKIDESTLKECPGAEAKLLMDYFGLQKKLGQLADGDNAWLKLVDKDHYVHGRVNQCGARTHRMSHFGPNMAQVDSDPRMRECWIPDEGEVLVGCDADSLELRMLAHYLGKYDDGEFSRSLLEGRKEDGTDVHSRNQKAAQFHSRDNAKTLIYALLYGAGDAKLGKIVRHDADGASVRVQGSDTALGKQVRANLLTGVKGLDRLVATVQRLHAKQQWLPAIDGRPIKSASEHSALNTLLQSAGGIVMKYALVIFDQTHGHLVNYCANVHDEVQMSVKPEHAEAVGQAFAAAIQKAGEHLGIRCPLKGNYDIGNSWADTH
ncbi:PolA DNA polymerase I - 3'-5' exonuclease and polymerase domains [uncultured Caudovirales phage]|uniref:DNA-directed DNA polymerase n=1 Tax=uncultured Caudovirales phage TaxID=2100421 RepID=A0A6J5P153_9CAUD|nr:PolA DNA polymerase I - 3'-5' exonuclease and polymerase domains [uncultured Caudovirales phage]